MINYGTHTTIKFGHSNVEEEYFNIANVKYYDAILSTPFLRKMGVVLDFSGPGTIKMGDKIIPNDRAIFNDLKKERSARMGKAPSKVRPAQKQALHAWVDLPKAQLSKLPIIMGSGMLQKWRCLRRDRHSKERQELKGVTGISQHNRRDKCLISDT